MMTKTCPECYAEVDASEHICFNCGADMTAVPSNQEAKLSGLDLLAAAFAALKQRWTRAR